MHFLNCRNSLMLEMSTTLLNCRNVKNAINHIINMLWYHHNATPTNLVSIHSSYGNSVSKMYLKPD